MAATAAAAARGTTGALRLRLRLQRLLQGCGGGGGGALAAAGSRGYAADAAADAEAAPLKRTVLYDFHVEQGAKMVPFAGWSMPLLYGDTILNSVLNCRRAGSLFDVSHMCGISLRGRDAIPFVETLVVGDIAGLPDGTGSLSALTNERGGTIDDTVVTKVDASHVYMVVNAGCRDKDLRHISGQLEAYRSRGKDVQLHVHDDRSLLALQGPLAAATLQRLVTRDLTTLYFGHFTTLDIHGAPGCFVTRTGYTGEDGFEVSVPSERAVEVARAMLERGEGRVLPTGLGARDALRLEAGLCLYGADMDEETSVVEAGLAWTVGKRRRAEGGGFLGADVILGQLQRGVGRRRVGIVSEGAPARSHCALHAAAAAGAAGSGQPPQAIGEVTSGGFSPCLKKNIAMGYVASGQHKEGTPLLVNVRGRLNPGVVTKMPFVPAKYYKKPASS